MTHIMQWIDTRRHNNHRQRHKQQAVKELDWGATNAKASISHLVVSLFVWGTKQCTCIM